jgi:hypothetical protein
MPYISQPQRAVLDKALTSLATIIEMEARNDYRTLPGLLNYAITRLMLDTIPEKRYWAIAMIDGVLNNVSKEWYRKYAVPYENLKCQLEGDLFPDTSRDPEWR